jgi:phenylacetate-CoA ligase
MEKTQLKKLQGKRLKKLVERVYTNVPFYREVLEKAGVTPEDINTIDDISRLPFTVKDDFHDNYPYGLFARPMEDIVRVHASSGTTGQPTVVGYTREDIELWASTCARTYSCGGGNNHDVIQVAYGYGLFTGGLGMHYGGEKLGATVIPMSSGNTKKQLQIMQDFGTTLICCTPTYALQLIEVAEEEGIDLPSLDLKAGFFGAEPWSDSMRKSLEEKMGLKALDIYGLSEIIGPGVASECLEHDGLHVFEDHFYPEIIDPETGEQLPEGEKGELVITCFTKQALPLIRYRTRDITSITREKCKCGRTLARMQRVSGRTDDMLIIRGINVFPSQIESVLLDIEETEPHYKLIVDREGNLDELEIQVEINAELFSDEIKVLEKMQKKIRHEIQNTLNLRAKITLAEPQTLERSQGKAQRVIDKRNK